MNGTSLNNRRLSTSEDLVGQKSGGVLPDLYLALADKYGNVVGNANGDKLSVRIDTSFESGAAN